MLELTEIICTDQKEHFFVIKISKYQNKITISLDFVPSKKPTKNPQPAPWVGVF